MKNIIQKIFTRFGIFEMLEEYQINQKKINWFNNLISDNPAYYENASVKNFQNDRSKIRIKENSIVRGHLKVLKYGGEIVIEKNSYIGNHSEIWSGCKVHIGEHVLISDHVFITDTNSHEVNHRERAQTYLNLLKNGPPNQIGSIEVKPVIIKDHAWINIGSIILKGVVIGKGSIVGAGSIVTKDVPDFSFVAGNPARVIKSLNP